MTPQNKSYVQFGKARGLWLSLGETLVQFSRPGLATRDTSRTVHRMPRTPPQAGTLDLIRQCRVEQPLYCGWAGLDQQLSQHVFAPWVVVVVVSFVRSIS